MIEIRRVVITEYFEMLEPLFNEHWLETESSVVQQKPSPSLQLYQALESAGCVVAHIAFDGDTPIGYCVVLVSPHLHYGFLYATHDVLFVDKGYRQGSLAIRLMKITEHVVKEMGAQYIAWHAKPGSVLDKILSRKKYSLEDNIYWSTLCQ